MTASLKPKLILAILAGVFVSATAGAEERIMFSTGGAQIRNAAGDLRPAVKGAEIRPGETIVTPPGGYVQAKMQAGFMAVRPDSQVRIDPLPSPGQAAVSANQVTLQQGAIRMLTAKQEGAPRAEASPRMVIVTPNANISLSNADGEAMIAPPKTIGAAPTTISVVNSGAVSVQGTIGAPVQVQANQGATVAGKAMPSVMMAAALPTLPSISLKTVAATPAGGAPTPRSQTAPTGLPAPAPGAKVLPAPSVTPVKPPMTPPMPAISPVTPLLATAPAIKPPIAPVTAPMVMPQPVIAPVMAPNVMPKPVIAPVISPVIAPLPVIAPIIKPPLTCTMVLINGVNQQVCR